MRIGVANFPPFLFAAIRQTSAGILLTGFLLLVKRMQLPSLRGIAMQAFAGFLMIAIGNGFVSWGEVYVPSGLAAIICSTMPLLVILINLIIGRSDKPDAQIVIGILIGLGGIVLVFSEHLSEFSNVNYRAGIILIFLASLGWAVGSILIKQNAQNSDPFLNAGLQMFFGGIICFVFSLFFDDLHNITITTPTVLSLTYLILIGSTVAFALYAYVLMKLPIAVASLYSYVNPLVAVILGWLILDEKLNPKIGIAILVTVLGIYLVNRSYQRKKEVR
jgi:drug/metabolite transporter (DMT)-like permease